MGRSIDQWVDYIQTLHHREIDLSLERVREVFLRMYPDGVPYKVISISGTNGKGSTAELLSSIYSRGGYRVGKFTSPHLVRFNERFSLNGEPIDDQRLFTAFERVERSRQDVPITFFEYGTLLAIDVFATSKVDLAVMEVGLGGRLDSVNILDADVSAVTSVSLDHTSWLGDTVELIAYEKVGIARKASPLVLGLPDPPENMLKYARDLGADVSLIGKNFNYQHQNQSNTWTWNGDGTSLRGLPLPFGQTGVQLSNCSVALEILNHLSRQLPLAEADIGRGIASASVLGRCQVFQSKPYIVFDVSHNETSVARLSQFISTTYRAQSPNGRILAVCGMLKDKEVQQSLAQISDLIDGWFTASIHNERGALAAEIAAVVSSLSDVQIHQYDCVKTAYSVAFDSLTTDDCLVVFGSFHIVGDILDHVS